ncbi:HK97-gp10 family putative phage morphogenesis protein [Bacillus sp. ISL-7]|uniref:HK97-gp10 family putative phage morphogenesis protein n=1 Tax=Bacillus sp. ISL-7 TaxID=2819136 RepID=UPI001BE4ED8F|nr:HK97-gp10 family putative phage morphogenesis protein [Bacillus sp. ISL-7]MBT2735137.1 HK97 gp10 family phage protein [Bacillus sp. ISL-7]
MNEVTFTGMDELLRRLEQLGEQAESVKKKALEEGAEVIRAEIESSTKRSNINHDHMADGIITNLKDDVIVIGPGVEYYYAHFLEFGTSKMAAQPFMGPSFERKKEAAKEKMAEVIRRELGL